MEIETLKFKTFKTKEQLTEWSNEQGLTKIVSMVKDVTNGEWILWYLSKPKFIWQYKTVAIPYWMDATDEEYELGKDLSRYKWRQIEK